MATVLVPMILAGGKGERFWPLSRQRRPKQFLDLDGSGTSLLQGTAARLLNLAGGWENLWVVTGAHLEAGARSQLPQANLLVEPEGRDTGPAVAWAAIEAAKRYGEEAVLGLFPADHWIADRAAFEQTLTAAATLAQEQGAIVTLGIQPTGPATGYGYIEQGSSVGTFCGLEAYQVSRFTEKPDATTAQAFLDSGRYSWNSGMFLFTAGTVLAELRTHAPEILLPLEAQGVAAYPHLPKLSIDYALMEKTQRACVLPAAFDWDDLGDWNALERLLKREGEANVAIGHHVALDTTGAIVYAGEGDVVATLGLEDVVVVRDGNVTLVVHKSRTQDIKQLVKHLQNSPEGRSLL
jgi:mannose-1-phosphate guanylyltransferase